MKIKKGAMELEQVVKLIIVLLVILALILFVGKFAVIKNAIVNFFG